MFFGVRWTLRGIFAVRDGVGGRTDLWMDLRFIRTIFNQHTNQDIGIESDHWVALSRRRVWMAFSISSMVTGF